MAERAQDGAYAQLRARVLLALRPHAPQRLGITGLGIASRHPPSIAGAVASKALSMRLEELDEPGREPELGAVGSRQEPRRGLDRERPRLVLEEIRESRCRARHRP